MFFILILVHHVFHSNIIAYCQQNWHIGLAMYSDLFTLGTNILLNIDEWLLLKTMFIWTEDTHREKTPSNKTSALAKSTNMEIWVAGTSNQLFVRGS